MTSHSRDGSHTTGIRLMLQGLSHPKTALAVGMADAPEPPESMTGLHTAWEHASVTLIIEISRQNQEQIPDDEGELAGAANLMHLWTLRALVTWAAKHRDEAAALEEALTLRVQDCATEQSHFDRRDRSDNAKAVRKAMEQALALPQAPKAPNLPLAARPTIELLRLETLKAIQQAEPDWPSQEGYLYDHEEHFNAFVTNQYCEVLLQASDPF